jgi:hypothetical protein
MDIHIKEFYKQFSEDFSSGHFKKVIALHDAADVTWETLESLKIKISKGWFELAHLPKEDRIEFTRDFWLSSLPYHPKLQNFIIRFFDSLDDIGIYITQKASNDEMQAQLVYSIANDGGFFCGYVPASDDDLNELEKKFPEFIFPGDFLAFFRIHNGFRKATDVTGIFHVDYISTFYDQFQNMLENTNQVVATERGLDVNPKSLIPFYESFGMPFFQCFWADWYPQNVTGMGNVYFSVKSKTVSDPLNYEDSSSLNMAFTTFSDWLMFYLERIE